MTSTLTDLDSEFAQIVDELTRRGFLAGGLGAAALLGLAACGSSAASGDGTSSGAAPKTLTVPTIHGNVRVPADPQRVIAFAFPEACALLDLGITPAGRPGYMPNFAAYNSALKGVAVIDEQSTGELIIEKIASLTPDLILGDDWVDPAKQRIPYDKLSTIAPTAIFAWEQAAGNWPDLAAQTAAAVGKGAALAALKSGYEDRARSIKTQYADLFGSMRWDLIDCGADYWDLYSANSSHGKVLVGAGVPLAAGASQTDGYKQYSLEQLNILADTDVIVTTAVSLPFLRKQKLFTNLPAVKAGRVYTTDLFFPASYGIALALLQDLATFCGKANA